VIVLEDLDLTRVRLATAALEALGELSLVARDAPYLEGLIPLVIESMQDQV
jgi:hypothetical protein